MQTEVVTPNAGGQESPVAVESNMSMEDFISRRSVQLTPPKEEPKDESPPEAVETPAPEAKERSEPEAKEPPKGKEVPSKEVDLEKMSEAELKELAEKLGSRAVARFGELTAKRKAAEEMVASLRAELSNRKIDPFASGKPKDNPYSSIKTLQELQAKANELDEVIEWADDVLWSNESMGPDDVVTNVNGQELTKTQVRKALRDAQKARKQHLPSQLAEIQDSEQRGIIRTQLVDAARKELDWMGGEDNDVRKQYEALRSSPMLEKAKKAVPELEPYLEYMVAHAANSIYGRKTIPISATSKPQIKPPSSPSGSSAETEKSDSRGSKAEKDSYARFKDSNSVTDFVAFRTEQINKRKSISQ